MTGTERISHSSLQVTEGRWCEPQPERKVEMSCPSKLKCPSEQTDGLVKHCYVTYHLRMQRHQMTASNDSWAKNEGKHIGTVFCITVSEALAGKSGNAEAGTIWRVFLFVLFLFLFSSDYCTCCQLQDDSRAQFLTRVLHHGFSLFFEPFHILELQLIKLIASFRTLKNRWTGVTFFFFFL